MTDLPTGWTETTLRAICSKIVDGSHNPPRAVAAGRPMLSARNVRDRAIHLDEFRFISDDDFEQEHARTQVQAGDVLLTIVGAIGRTAVVPSGAPVFALQRSVAVLRPLAMEPRALAYALEAPDVQKYMTDNARGTAQKGIYLGTLATVEVKLPPAAEQQRIADKLDTVLARVDACRDRLARVAPLLKRFRQSVLSAATSGRLTDDWRAGNRGLDWQAATIEGICRSVADGDHQAPPQASSGIPFITIAAINDGRLSLQKATRYVPRPYFDGLADKRRPQRGDVLYSVTGSLGIPALVDVDTAFTFQRHIAILRPQLDRISSEYLYYVLGCSHVREQALAAATGSAQLTLALGSLKAISIELPQPIEQTEIVRRVETLFAFADRLEARLRQAQTAIDRLTPSLLATAFRGELVPQDPNDEPASTLLARITAERSAPAPTSRPRSPSAGRPPRAPKETAAMTKSRQDDDVMGQPYLAGRLRRVGTPTSAEALFKLAELPVADFYKQLAWEVAQGHVKDNQTTLEPGYAAG